MTYLSWAAMHEGTTDEAYFGIIIPILLEDLVRCRGTRNVTVPLTAAINLGKSGRTVQAVASEICEEHSAFHIVFIHADTGGRALEAGMDHRSEAYRQAAFELCGFPLERCVVVAPRHETEAWMLADQEAIGEAFGYRGDLDILGLPKNAQEAEKLVDPKLVLSRAIKTIRGRRSKPNVHQVISAIAQRQSLGKLRCSESFQQFEMGIVAALVSLGCIE
ncbi:DUF4276 family protein [Sphingobium sp. Z007]|uniref:DUF4276 family protein n=1 Tax=Sphingobium sp. Z007 TaxID=627495 RepID=UPI000B499C89|nr:DUF4276 family protein [Sphingobium sp. Z007]